jgi:sodium/hydrogen antiporter
MTDLHFHFTNMAIAMALIGVHPNLWFTDWLIKDFFYKIIAGTIIGFGTGWLLAKIIFSYSAPKTQSSKLSVGLLSLTLTLFPYGLAEIIHSYGFISVFVAACTFRYQEATNEYLNVLHNFSEEMERVLVAVLFTYAGIYLSQNFINDFHWYMIPACYAYCAFHQTVYRIC